jgi:hypothetical protein
MALANLSMSPPGGYGTISVMGLVGQASADTEISSVVTKAKIFFIMFFGISVEGQEHFGCS